MNKRQQALILMAAVMLMTAVSASAQNRELDDATILNIQWENDAFILDGQDKHYTNGLRFSFLRPDDRVPSWVLKSARAVPWFPKGGRIRPAWSLGQSLYTPEDIKTTELVEDDRPYAAWLYVGAGLVVENGRILDVMEFSLGVVGPAALGEQVQSGIHEIIDSPLPQGWDNQLHNELTVQATWQRKWRQLHVGDHGFGVDVLPHIGGTLGNVHIYGAGGATVRLGWDLPGDYGPPRIQPALPGSEFFVPRRTFGGYFFVGAEGRVVLRDMFLDGNTFGHSHSVEKNTIVGDMQGGFALVYHGFRLAYTYVVRTKEFKNQNGNDAFGAFTISFRI